MELCSLEDAFPDIGASGPSKEERRAAKKKAKRCKGSISPGADVVSPDPDRPFVKKAGEVSALMSYGDAFPDLSGVVRDSVPAFRAVSANTESFKMPTLPGAACSFSDPGLPSYFGKDVEDEEGFADYSSNPTDLAGYMLGSPPVAGAAAAAVGKAGSAVLPDVPANDAWKPLTPAGARSAYFQDFPPGTRPRTQSRTVERVEPELIQVVSPREDSRKGGAPLKTSDITDTTREQLLQRIQDLTKRLDELETRATRNSQQEILIFVGAGLGLLLTFDLAMRMRGRH